MSDEHDPFRAELEEEGALGDAARWALLGAVGAGMAMALAFVVWAMWEVWK
jgi:hypothetical protein